MSASLPGHWSTRWKRNLAGGNNQGGASWLHGMYLAHRYSTCGGLRWFDLSIHMAGSRKSMEIPHPWAHPPHLRWFKIVARLERHTHFATALRSLDLRHSFYQYLSQNNYENLIKSPYKTQHCAAILKQCVAGGEPSCFRIFHHSGGGCLPHDLRWPRRWRERSLVGVLAAVLEHVGTNGQGVLEALRGS